MDGSKCTPIKELTIQAKFRDRSNSTEDKSHKMRVDYTTSEIVIYDVFLISNARKFPVHAMNSWAYIMRNLH
jgi:hypothetical protein